MSSSKDQTFIETGKQVLQIEAEAIDQLIPSIGQEFAQACEYLFDCTGRVVVTGMGKSGHIAKKIAATLASTGTPSFFVHPGEASHGDMGMITANDVVLALSNSGETSEVLTMFPLIKRLGAKVISMTGADTSKMATAADTHIFVPVEKEACPLNLAPTSSSTAMLAMGDALAVALLKARGFTAEDFAFSHPGGSLGRQLLTRVDDIMAAGKSMPIVSNQTDIIAALEEMSRCGLGMTLIEEAGKFVGIFTDGDLRRSIKEKPNTADLKMADIMSRGAKTIQSGSLAVEAANAMEEYSINALVVVDDQEQALGVITMHHLLHAKVV